MMERGRYYRHLKQLSGSSYVPSELKIDHDRFQLRIRKPRNCDHQNTICPTRSCVRSWMCDYKLWFARTAGGRRLAEQVGIDPNIRQSDEVTNEPSISQDGENVNDQHGSELRSGLDELSTVVGAAPLRTEQ